MQQVKKILKKKAVFSSFFLFLYLQFFYIEYKAKEVGKDLRSSAAQIYERRSDKVNQFFTLSQIVLNLPGKPSPLLDCPHSVKVFLISN